MFFSGLTFEEVWSKLHTSTLTGEAVVRFICFLERRLGGRFLYDLRKVPFGETDLLDLFELAEKLRNAGVIRTFNPTGRYVDEPPFYQWRVECATKSNENGGGMSIISERDAFVPALAEGVERYIWMLATDYFDDPRTATTKEIQGFGATIIPEQFVGFSPEQRKDEQLLLREDARYLWIKGDSHTTDGPVRIPAQVVSGAHGAKVRHHGAEPLILDPITTGLATGPTRAFALLNGALEILERDAFMITWLNQLTPPRIDIEDVAANDPLLAKLLRMCERYRLGITAVLLPTDAPAYTVCAVVRDDSGVGPNVTLGLKAHRSLADAIRGASLEALRIRQTVRLRNSNAPFDSHKDVRDIVHVERAQYWATTGSAEKLAFLVSGAVTSATPQPWDADTVDTHWKRIVEWCAENHYECASVDLGKSKFNVSPWYIEMVMMPQMQPMHQTERLIYLGGDRLTEVPKRFGYTPRSEPYQTEPHPFA